MLKIALLCIAVSSVDVTPPAAAGAFAPRLTPSPDGPWLSWLEPAPGAAKNGGRALRLRVAQLRPEGWTTPETVVERGDLFGNWADLPAVIEAGSGERYASWLQKSAGGKYTYDVQLARRVRGAWSPIGPLHDDGVPAEHGFVSGVALSNAVQFFWLDGRQTPKGGPMTLRTARVRGGKVEDSTVIDERVCDCCATAASLAPGGARVVYRDRSATEIRDISTAVVRGRRVSASTAVAEDSWQMPGCPVNGPGIDTHQNTTATAWFTGAGGAASVRAAFLKGGSFAPPIVVQAERALGRVDVAVLNANEAVVSSLVTRADDPLRAAVTLRRVDRVGRLGAPFIAGETAAGRDSGFPQIERVGETLVVVWTHVEGEQTSLQAVRVPVSRLPKVTSAAATRGPTAVRAAPSRIPELPLATLAGARTAMRPSGVRVVHLWATWCAPCLEEMPSLLAALRPYEDGGVQLAVVSVDDGKRRDQVGDLARGWGAEDVVLLDIDGVAEERLSSTVVPTTYVYDATGALRFSASGKVDVAALRRAIDGALRDAR